MGRRSLGPLVAIAAFGLLVSPADAARHRFQWGDEDDPVSVRQDFEFGDVFRHAGTVAVRPRSSPAPIPEIGGPLIAPLPESPRPEQLPSVELGEGSGATLPDLAPVAAWGVYVDESIPDVVAGDEALSYTDGSDPYAGSKKAIRFGTTIRNVGRHSLEIVGVPRPTGDARDPVRVEAVQCVRFAGPRVEGAERACQASEPVGSLSFHAQHGHFHIDGFAQYRLLRDRAGRPDTRPAGVVSSSEKVGFCMGDTDDFREPHRAVDTGWYRECRHTAPHVPATLRQGISPGWGDSYRPELPGQHLVIEGVPDGVYWIAITVNPAEFAKIVRLQEVTRANNTSYRRVQLLQKGTAVKVL